MTNPDVPAGTSTKPRAWLRREESTSELTGLMVREPTSVMMTGWPLTQLPAIAPAPLTALEAPLPKARAQPLDSLWNSPRIPEPPSSPRISPLRLTNRSREGSMKPVMAMKARSRSLPRIWPMRTVPLERDHPSPETYRVSSRRNEGHTSELQSLAYLVCRL